MGLKAACSASGWMLVFALAACAAPPRKPPPRVAAPGARPAAPRPLAAGERAELDRKFYMAVVAYRQGDYAGAEGYLGEILKADPKEPNALSLRRRVRALEAAR